MSLLYNNANRLTQQLRKDLAKFETDPGATPPTLLGQITTTVNTLGRTLRDYGEYIDHQTLGLNEAQKVKNQNRLAQLNKEYAEYKQQFDLLRKQREALQAEQNRSQLFSNPSTAISDNPYEDSGMTMRGKGAQQAMAPSLSMQEGLYKEQTALERSNQQLDEILEMGRGAFNDLVEQNEVVAKMRDKMSSSLQTMGVSRATISKIEKKAFEDKWIFYIGGGLTVFIMYLIWHYLG